jgi:NNP family nitrate/nitrite transporter-like MFS transporter
MEDDRKGHLPTLVACFLHFDLSFMLWVLLGALGIFIADEAHLGPAEKGLVVALPILSGSLLRFPAGVLADRIGGKRVGVAMLAFLFVPLTLGWLGGGSLRSLLIVGALLGTAGASFAVALPLASRAYPPHRQGLVMGIAAAGNTGTVITNLVAPRLARVVGWHQVLALAMIPLAAVLIVFSLTARQDGAPRRRSRVRDVAGHSDLWWFCLFYAVTFGGYVGLGSFMPILLRDQYGASPVTAGMLTAMIAFAGSASRPLGGWLADRLGGSRMLTFLLAQVSLAYLLASRLPSLGPMAATMVATMLWLGMGNGAVFQLVPQRFRDDIGVATGIVGAVGGLGGFMLPTLLGAMKARTGSFSAGFMVLAVLAGAAAVALRALVVVQRPWRLSWREAATRQPGTAGSSPGA